MKVKKILEKVWSALYWLILADFTIRFLLGKADIIVIIALGINYTLILFNFVLDLFLKLKQYEAHKIYKDGFEYLKDVHKARYKLYLQAGDKEKIEAYSKEIERYGNILLSIGQERLEDQKLSNKIHKEVNGIVDETKKLMTTIQAF